MLRSFIYDGQWNIIYYPKQPSGFSVMIIGDHNHYVNNMDSFWLQHPGRRQIVEMLLKQGYTGFSFNLYGRHLGNDKSVQLMKVLYQIIMKKEVLNRKIHVLAEGEGALVVLKLMEQIPEYLRSVVFLNPCLSIKQKWRNERDKMVYLSPFMKTLSQAYDEKKEQMEEVYDCLEDQAIHLSVPTKIIHVLGNDSKEQFDLYKQLEETYKQDLEIIYLLPEKRYKTATEAIKFMKKHENVL